MTADPLILASIPASALIGRRVTLVPHGTPTRVLEIGCSVLTQLTRGVIVEFGQSSYSGAFGLLRIDDGHMIAFDAASDLATGLVQMVVGD